MKFIFGLGNCESKFDNTPHNAGFATVDLVANKLGCNFNKKKLDGIIAETVFNGDKIVLIKPQTYMNNSGECVKKFVKKFKIDLKNILIVYDDIDLNLGTIRFRQQGSAGTHNGMRNIVQELQTTEIPRLRIGVGQPPEKMELADFVLSKFNQEQFLIFKQGVELGADEILNFIQG